MSLSDLGILIKSAFGDAVERKRHRLPQTGSAEETRVYAYFGLKALNEIRFEPPSKVVQLGIIGTATQANTDHLQYRIEELEQLRTETAVKETEVSKLKSKLSAETQKRQEL